MKCGLGGAVCVVVGDGGEQLSVFAALDAGVAVIGQMEQPLGSGFQRLEDRLQQGIGRELDDDGAKARIGRGDRRLVATLGRPPCRIKLGSKRIQSRAVCTIGRQTCGKHLEALADVEQIGGAALT
ncbi:MAG: hypothetical protein QOJ80_3590 [Mycobacterium sp.]|nr:hypothetical protein [Mycobacterium sp.]